MKMYIHAPTIVDYNNRVRLQAYIEFSEFQDGGKTIWYEVEKKYEDFLTVERADAFLVAVLPYAMVHSLESDPLEIIIEQEISEKLFYMLTQYYIPILSKNTKRYSWISIQAPYSSQVLTQNKAVATGITGGIDSTYTVLRHLNVTENFKITHGVFCSVGAFGKLYGAEEMLQINNAQKVCKAHNLEFICVTSNLCIDLYREVHDAIVSTFMMSHALCLQKLFSVYLYSDAFSFCRTELIESSMPHYDILTVQCLSTENLSFFSSGMEVTRLDKVKYISKFVEPREYLMVCGSPDLNGIHCGKCSKCTRTMLELYAIGELDKFNKVFNIQDFYNNINDHLAYIIMKRKKDAFAKELLAEFKKRGIHITVKAWIDAFIKWAKHGFRSENPHHYDYLP